MVTSRFAALKAVKGFAAMEPGTDTWLWERCTLRVFRLKLPIDVKSDFSKQFNEMIDLYDRLTDFCWPTEWEVNVSCLHHLLPRFSSNRRLEFYPTVL